MMQKKREPPSGRFHCCYTSYHDLALGGGSALLYHVEILGVVVVLSLVRASSRGQNRGKMD